MAAWVEDAFGLSTEDGSLVRHPPERFADAVARLSEDSGVDIDSSEQKLRDILDAGNLALVNPNQPVFAFRLHQFLSSGSSVRATWSLWTSVNSLWKATTRPMRIKSSSP